jgi:hypothetical protein
VVFGRWCHRLSSDLRVIGSRELPRARPYNSLVILADGALVMKDLDRTCRQPATITVLTPELEPAAEVEAPESSIARLSADGDRLYVLGDRTLLRYRWEAHPGTLARDDDWAFRYRTRPDQGYGWDVVLEGGHAWFMDNGRHDYTSTMLGAGLDPGPIHLFRVSLESSRDTTAVEVSGSPRGACTNPPLYDPERRIALGYDSANGMLGAWRLAADGSLERLWKRPLATAGHLVRFPDTGEVMAYDFHSRVAPRTAWQRRLARPGARLIARPGVRRWLSRASREDVVLLDIGSGKEIGRASVPTVFQSVVFPAPGWNRDLYYCSFSTIARITPV